MGFGYDKIYLQLRLLREGGRKEKKTNAKLIDILPGSTVGGGSTVVRLVATRTHSHLLLST